MTNEELSKQVAEMIADRCSSAMSAYRAVKVEGQVDNGIHLLGFAIANLKRAKERLRCLEEEEQGKRKTQADRPTKRQWETKWLGCPPQPTTEPIHRDQSSP